MVVPWLPYELWIQIIGNVVDPGALFSFRLVNHAWNEIATQQFTRHIGFLSVHPASQDDTEWRVRSEKINLLTNAILVLLPNSDEYYFRIPSQPTTLRNSPACEHWEGMRIVLRDEVPRFKNLRHMAVQFWPSPKVLGPDQVPAFSYEQWAYQMVEDLLYTWRQFRYGLDELPLECLPVHALTPGSPCGLNEQQHATTVEILDSLKLKSLKLAWVGPNVWPQSTPPSWNMYGPANMWISPVKSTLRHLSVSCWGFYTVEWSRFGRDGPDFHIPNLETLEMHGCTFATDRGFRWILSHKETLHWLKFDDCAIIHCLQTHPENPFISQTLIQKVEMKHGLKLGLCTLRWQEWFHKFRAELKNLTNFQFGSSRVRAPGEEGPVFESERAKGPRFPHKATFLMGIFPDRYLEMAQNIPQAPWILDPPKQTYKKRPECEKADLVALQLLLKHTKQYVDENATSDHAGYVVNLLGRVKPRVEE